MGLTDMASSPDGNHAMPCREGGVDCREFVNRGVYMCMMALSPDENHAPPCREWGSIHGLCKGSMGVNTVSGIIWGLLEKVPLRNAEGSSIMKTRNP